MAEQGVEMIHAICEREQCGYDDLIDKSNEKSVGCISVVIGFVFAGLLTMFLGVIGIVIGVFILIVSVIAAGMKSIECPACLKGKMHDVEGDRGAALYVRKYSSRMED